MTAVATLEELIWEVDFPGVEAWLRDADEEEMAQARKWYVKGRAATRRLYAADSRDWHGRRLSHQSPRQPGRNFWHEWHMIRAHLAITLAGPSTAAKEVPWARLSPYRQMHDELLVLIETALARGAEWTREFVPVAAATRMGTTEISDNAPVLFRILHPLVLEHGLPTPQGHAFIRGWLAHHLAGVEDPLVDLTERLTTDALMPDAFHHLMADGSLGHFENAPEVVATLVTHDRLDRTRLIDEAFGHLASQQPPRAQRVLARMLMALGLTPGEVPGGLPALQGAIATCHGSVGAILLPFAIDMLATGDDLVELCTTIAGRPEKAQKVVLVRALSDANVVQRVGRQPAVEALTMLRGTTHDRAFVAKVEGALAALGGSAPEASEIQAPNGLWDLEPPGVPYVPPPVEEWPHITTEVGEGLVREVRESTHGWGLPDTSPDLYLAAIVRHAWKTNVPDIRDYLERLARTRTYGTILGEAICDWVDHPGVDSYIAARARAGTHEMDEKFRQVRPYSLADPSSAFRFLIAREALLRLGRSPCLLSTPTHADHTLTFDALAERLEQCRNTSVGALDLLQALLRLEPVNVSSLARLHGLAVPLDDTVLPVDEQFDDLDASEVIRSWVVAGGLPPLAARLEGDERGRYSWKSDDVPPVPSALLNLAPRGFLADNTSYSPSLELVRIAPRWSERLECHDGWALLPSQAVRQYDVDRFCSDQLDRTCPMESVALDTLLRMLASPSGKNIPVFARTALELIGAGWVDTDDLLRIAILRLDHGVLGLSRLVQAWSLMAHEGGLRFLWPVMLGVADHASAMARKPAGLPELLRLMISLVPEVPSPEVPPAVRTCAETTGATKTHHEARAFVEAVERARVAA